MLSLTSKCYEVWKNRLSEDYPHTHHDITAWLFRGCQQCNLSAFEVAQLIDYRYRLFQKRYAGYSQKQGYKNLVRRLSAIILEYPPIRRKFAYKSGSQFAILRLTQAILTEMLNHDRQVQTLIDEMEQFTPELGLKEQLILASLEEYASEIIKGQPRILRYLRQYLEAEQMRLSA